MSTFSIYPNGGKSLLLVVLSPNLVFAYIVGAGPGGAPGIGDAGGPIGEGHLAPLARAEPVGAVRVPNTLHANVVVAERSSRMEGAVRVSEALHALLLAHVADTEPAAGPDIALVR